MNIKKQYNDFFVQAFNLILKQEENMLSHFDKKLSVKEMHLIDAVGINSPNNTMKDIAKKLGISLGSLTVAVKPLTEKKYLVKEKDLSDKRVSRLVLTQKGVQAYYRHEQFHKNMIDYVIDNLEENQAEVLIKALENLAKFIGDSYEN